MKTLRSVLLYTLLSVGSLGPFCVNAQVAGAIAVYPANSSTEFTSTRQFSAYVPISPNMITWLVNDIPGGDATVGTISATGLYQPPAVIPAANIFTIKARSAAYPASVGSATLTVTKKYPWLWSVSPSKLQTGNFSVSFNGSNFAPDSQATANGVDVSTVYMSPTKLVVSGNAPAPGTIQFAVRQPGPGAVTGNSVSATVSVATVTIGVSPTSATVGLGTSSAFTATVTGSDNKAVLWSVNGTAGGSSTVGTITSGGIYSAPAVMPASSTVTVRATSVASPSSFAQTMVSLVSPPPPSVWLDGARFLEQSSFGPTPATLAAVEQIGIDAYLADQFSLPETPIPTPAENSIGPLRQWVSYNYTTAPDQLRQRVAYSLSQIIVTSANKLIYPDAMLPWLRLLSQHAFGNYRDLLHDITVCPSMGKFLDLANSKKPGMAGGANENYARELMQLFTIGLWQLNPDGSQVLDAYGQPVPTYDQETVRQVALALTGWTYATAPGATPQNSNWEYFDAPMESRQQNHATSAKSILGTVLPADKNTGMTCPPWWKPPIKRCFTAGCRMR